jgi:hypothetical protein
VTVIEAPGIATPFASRTVPAIFPEEGWADAGIPRRMSAAPDNTMNVLKRNMCTSSFSN